MSHQAPFELSSSVLLAMDPNPTAHGQVLIIHAPFPAVEVMDRIKFSGSHHIYVTFERKTDARQAVLNADSTVIFGHHCRVHHQQLQPLSKAFVESLLHEEDRENQKAATLRQMQEEEAKKVEEAEKKKAKKWAPVQTSKPTR